MSMSSWSKGSGEGERAPRACLSTHWTSLSIPLCVTDCDTESHRPRGPVGFLFLELAALCAYFEEGVDSPREKETTLRPRVMVFAIASVAQ